MAWLLLLTLPTALAAWYAFVRYYEVPYNATTITANGSADDLRKGFHQRRSWVRAEVAAGLAVVGACPAPIWPAFGLLAAALLVLMAGFFARYFTPWLNVAMKLDYKPEYYCSPDSPTWPDAKVWKAIRPEFPYYIDAQIQSMANMELARLLTRTWRICYWLAVALAGAGFYYCLR